MRTTLGGRLCTWAGVMLLVGILVLFSMWAMRQGSLTQELIAAVYAYDAPAADAALNKGADPNTCAPEKLGSLWQRMLEAVMSRRGRRGIPLVAQAAREHQWPVVESLVRHGADPDVDLWGTPLEYAAEHSEKTARLLLERGASPRFRSTYGSPVRSAVIGNHYALVAELLRRGADPNGAGAYESPLALLVERRSASEAGLACMRAMLDRGADPNDGALQAAVIHGDLAAARLLLDRGADPDGGMAGAANRLGGRMGPALRSLGGTPVWLAASRGQAPMVQLLVGRGADPTVVGQTGRTPAQEAAARPFRDVARVLRQAEAEWRRKHPKAEAGTAGR